MVECAFLVYYQLQQANSSDSGDHPILTVLGNVTSQYLIFFQLYIDVVYIFLAILNLGKR